MSEGDRKRRFLYGELNPINKPRMTRAVDGRRLSKTSLLDSMREATYETIYGVDALNNTGPFYGIILKRLDPNIDNFLPADHPIRSWNGKTFNTGFEKMIAVKVRIPELHAHIPDPFDYPVDSVQFNNFMDMYPTFVGKQGTGGEPERGMLALVDFQNKQEFSGGLYLGLHQDGAVAAVGPDVIENSRQSFNNCVNDLMNDAPSQENNFVPNIFSSVNNVREECKSSIIRAPNAKEINEIKDLPGVRGAIKKLGGLPQYVWDNLKQTLAFIRTVERYWKKYSPDARIIPTSVLRTEKHGGVKNSAHGVGLAFDSTISIGGNLLSVNRVYAGFKKMINAGILPKGGLGIYVNVAVWDQLKWNSPRSYDPVTGRESKSGPAGSANVHYDWRGDDRAQGYNKRGGARWVWLDLDGDVSDDLATDGPGGSRARISRSQLRDRYPDIYNLVFGDAWRTTPGVPDV